MPWIPKEGSLPPTTTKDSGYSPTVPVPRTLQSSLQVWGPDSDAGPPFSQFPFAAVERMPWIVHPVGGPTRIGFKLELGSAPPRLTAHRSCPRPLPAHTSCAQMPHALPPDCGPVAGEHRTEKSIYAGWTGAPNSEGTWECHPSLSGWHSPEAL